MADVDASGFLIGRDGFTIPVLRTDLLEGATEECQSDVNYTVAAQSVGQYATQSGRRFILHQGIMTAENQATYAYILGLGGQIKCAIATAKTSVGNGPVVNPYPVSLVSGDSLQMRANTATDREVALIVATNRGIYHIFSGSPSGAGELELTSIVTNQSIGQTLQGQTVTHAWVSADGANNIISGGGVYFLNGAGSVVGGISAMDTQLGVMSWSKVSIPIGLSYQCVVRTDA